MTWNIAYVPLYYLFIFFFQQKVLSPLGMAGLTKNRKSETSVYIFQTVIEF